MDILGLIPSFGGLLYTIGAFVVALSVIVAIHEYGHYIVGRWCGIKAEVFSVGFGPVLWSRRDRHGTQWQVAALPFGGYVKFLGDASAVSDRADEETMAHLDAKARRQTMHGAPLWARAATVAAGPVFNFILSFFVFAAILMLRGVAADPLTIDTIRPLPAAVQELQPGDQLLAVDGRAVPPMEELSGFLESLPLRETLDYSVRRDGAETLARAPYPYPPIALGITPGSAAMDIDMRPGDVIRAIDGEPIFAFSQLRDRVAESDGRVLLLEVWRDGETLEFALAPRRMDLPLSDGGFETRWLIGITGGWLFEPQTTAPTLIEAARYGVDQTIYIIQSSLSGLYHMAAGLISTCNLQGPIGIAETSGAAASQGWLSFIWFIAVLSTAVGLLNLFPIPVLDGGHLVFHAWEALTGRPPSDGALRVMMGAGLALMGALMIFALSNDLLCP
ncbi:RIP metalloprotease RseP [Palleronia sp. KMU-117]|uniref:RIP metalloprotease RseP n=1 Tax=Palleronia sp. KMU-117 TaxID=3434108 RepID=UPI003D74F568